jgi:putative transposase
MSCDRSAPREKLAATHGTVVPKCQKRGRGYRRITALLRAEGWWMNHKRVERIWRQEDLKVAAKQPKRRRLWLGDGSCIRLRPTHRNHVWSFRLVMDRTSEGRAFRMLTTVDEFTRECLGIDVSRKLTSEDVLERLSDMFVRRGVPDHIRSDNGSEFTAKRVREWLERVGVKTLSIEPGSPLENGYVESFNGKLRDELLDREVFDTLLEAKVLIGRWRKAYNTVRPHSSLGYRPPAPEPCRRVKYQIAGRIVGQGISVDASTDPFEESRLHGPGGAAPENARAPAPPRPNRTPQKRNALDRPACAGLERVASEAACTQLHKRLHFVRSFVL